LKVRILYGGDVNAGNAADLMAGSDASGFLVGRASVEASEFIGVIKAAA
jgi:triosephosphate isomerase